jgi:phosphoribosyl-AMP cyclohydrolase / phosphoribosyl-ATP pyrophosphohydrolase
MNIESLKFDEKGLIPAIVQDAFSKEVLTLAYMNIDSIKKSIETKETWFYSRSRRELWHKGATSGNSQNILEIMFDCDKDALLVLVEPVGPACHSGTISCFNESLYDREPVSIQNKLNDYQILLELEQVIRKRETERNEGAYTTYLFEKGVDKILKKVGEEASEVIIAAKNCDKEELKWEVADLIYHLLVLLQEQKLPFNEVLSVLNKRKDGKNSTN